MYLGERPEWPEFTWNDQSLSRLLTAVARGQGRLLGRMEALGFNLRDEAHLRTLTEDVVKSSEIEGAELEPNEVRSSIARRLGMDAGGLALVNRDVRGGRPIGELVRHARDGYGSARNRTTSRIGDVDQ